MTNATAPRSQGAMVPRQGFGNECVNDSQSIARPLIHRGLIQNLGRLGLEPCLVRTGHVLLSVLLSVRRGQRYIHLLHSYARRQHPRSSTRLEDIPDERLGRYISPLELNLFHVALLHPYSSPRRIPDQCGRPPAPSIIIWTASYLLSVRVEN